MGFKMATQFLWCTWSIFWVQASKAICWILVLTLNRQWAMKFPTRFVFKVLVYILSFPHKVACKSESVLFHCKHLDIAAQRID